MTSHDSSSVPSPVPTLRQLGRSDLFVSPLCLGTNTFGWTTDEAASFAVLDAFIDAGGTFIDTADIYCTWTNQGAGGQSETILGRWLASRRTPANLVIATKIGKPMPYGSGLTADYLPRALDESLTRLGLDHVDLLYTHEDNHKVPQEETMATLGSFVSEGKVRVLGASNFFADRLVSANAIAEAAGTARYDVLQPPYNLLDRDEFEGDLQDACVASDISVVPYYGLARGFLTGKYQQGEPAPDSQRSSGTLDSYGTERGWQALRAVEAVAKRHNATPAQVSLAWIAAQSAIVSPVVSATTPEQIRDIAGSMAIELSDEYIREMSQAGRARVGSTD